MLRSSLADRVLFLVLFLGTSVAWCKSVVVIGDSHSCGSFGKNLVRVVAKEGHDVTLYCTESSAPKHWVRGESPSFMRDGKPEVKPCLRSTSTDGRSKLCFNKAGMPRLDELLKAHRGAQFIVALGTNSLGSPSADIHYRRMAEQVRATSETCTWIGAPHLNVSQAKGAQALRVKAMESNGDRFFDSMAEAVGASCDVVDSRDATKLKTDGAETVDGVHRGEVAGKYWVDQIRAALMKKLGPATGPPLTKPTSM